jgi:ABC-type multidrug transport system fused ATPase/permease subunit
MSTIREKAQYRRLKVVDFYSNAWEFIIRLLMGLGIYVILQIILMTYLKHVQSISISFADSLAELMVLIISAVLMLFFIWLKGSRSHLLAAIFLPVIFCLVLINTIRFIQLLLLGDSNEALFGFLPFILPLLLILIYWLFDFKALWLKIIASLLFLGMSIFWLSDIPKSLDEARNIQTLVQEYQVFSDNLQKFHILNWEESPEFLETGDVQSSWHYKKVIPEEYNIADELKGVVALELVIAIDIDIPGIKSELKENTQELGFKTLHHVGLHYFYKYSITRKIVIKDFQFTGDSFFLLELENSVRIVDNVLIRKKEKE